jgi:hypothetical protein
VTSLERLMTAVPFQSVNRVEVAHVEVARMEVSGAVEFDENSYSARVCRCGGRMGLTVATTEARAQWCCSSCGRRQRR